MTVTPANINRAVLSLFLATNQTIQGTITKHTANHHLQVNTEVVNHIFCISIVDDWIASYTFVSCCKPSSFIAWNTSLNISLLIGCSFEHPQSLICLLYTSDAAD